MNMKFLISVIVAFVIAMGSSFLIHAMLLHNDYAALPNMFRSEADGAQYFPYMLLAHVFIAVNFAWIYRQGVTNASWLTQGLRYGIAVACLAVIPMYLIYYAVQPMPPVLVGKQIIYETIAYIVMGLAIAFINKPSQSAA